jgi:hypothetical protein
MAQQPYAAAISSNKPLRGQDNRSGPNFQFVSVPRTGNLTVTVTGESAASLECAIMEDVSGGRDPIITTIRNGSTVDASKFKDDKRYYLASPNGTGRTNFEVTFMG